MLCDCYHTRGPLTPILKEIFLGNGWPLAKGQIKAPAAWKITITENSINFVCIIILFGTKLYIWWDLVNGVFFDGALLLTKNEWVILAIINNNNIIPGNWDE